MTDSLSLQLAHEIRSLVTTPVLKEADLILWTEQADALRQELESTYKSLESAIPEELEHYFQDPDIRLKDVGYNDRQTKIIQKIISDLESGKIAEKAAKLKLKPKWTFRRRAGIFYLPLSVALLFFWGTDFSPETGAMSLIYLFAEMYLFTLGFCLLVGGISYHAFDLLRWIVRGCRNESDLDSR